jgi:hypothetical protein
MRRERFPAFSNYPRNFFVVLRNETMHKIRFVACIYIINEIEV